MNRTSGSRTAAANSARSARSAELDAIAYATMRQCVAKRFGCIPERANATEEGFPHFYMAHGMWQQIADELNRSGVRAPRGGMWTVKQVSRALLRCAGRTDLTLPI